MFIFKFNLCKYGYIQKSHIKRHLYIILHNNDFFQLLYFFFSYPGAIFEPLPEALLPSPLCGVSGGTGDPPDSSDGVLDKNRLPPNSETNVIGELFLNIFIVCFFFLFVHV